MKLFSQQPLEAHVVCLQDGELVEGDPLVDSPGLRLWILLPNLGIVRDRLGVRALGALWRGAG